MPAEINDVEVIDIRGNDAEIRVGDRVHIVPFIVQGSVVSFAFDGEIYTIDTAGTSAGRASRQSETVSSDPRTMSRSSVIRRSKSSARSGERS